MIDLTTTLGPLALRSPLVAASGTVGSVVDFVEVGALEVYGAAVAKSVSAEPWEGLAAPRLAPVGAGMLNAIGIQNPGIEAWVRRNGPLLEELPVPVWGSAVGRSIDEYRRVARGLAAAGIAAVEVNLSCPNLENGAMFALDPGATGAAVAAIAEEVDIPVGAKLSPNAADIAQVAEAAVEAGADWLVLTNTVWGAGVDVDAGRPLLSGGVGGYSGPPLKPIALRCVLEVRAALPEVPIVGCGGVCSGRDAAEFLMAGATAVALGTIHFAEPRAGRRILRELEALCRRKGLTAVRDLVGAVRSW